MKGNAQLSTRWLQRLESGGVRKLGGKKVNTSLVEGKKRRSKTVSENNNNKKGGEREGGNRGYRSMPDKNETGKSRLGLKKDSPTALLSLQQKGGTRC